MYNVAIDFSHIGELSGFGNIADNYAPILAGMTDSELHFIFIVPRKMIGAFGNNVDYADASNPLRDLERQHLEVHLWHCTDHFLRCPKRNRKLKRLLTVHDMSFLDEKKGIHKLKHRFLVGRNIRRADYITVISKYVGDDMKRCFDTGGKPCKVIYNGVESLDKKPESKPKFVSDGGEKFFFTLGTMRRKKNFHTLLPMMKHFPDTKLYVCGNDNYAYAEEMRSLLTPRERQQTLIAGSITDAEKVWMYRHCRAFLLPSTLEGFGLPAIEAMHAGVPVVLAALSSLPEIGGRHAWYWHDFEPESMAGVVKDALAEFDEPHRRAAKNYAATYNYGAYTDAYIELYKQMLHNNI